MSESIVRDQVIGGKGSRRRMRAWDIQTYIVIWEVGGRMGPPWFMAEIGRNNTYTGLLFAIFTHTNNVPGQILWLWQYTVYEHTTALCWCNIEPRNSGTKYHIMSLSWFHIYLWMTASERKTDKSTSVNIIEEEKIDVKRRKTSIKLFWNSLLRLY